MASGQWSEVSPEMKQELDTMFSPYSAVKDVLVHDNGMVISRVFAEKLEERIKSFELRPDDIWVVTYPKSGTTWTQVRQQR